MFSSRMVIMMMSEADASFCTKPFVYLKNISEMINKHKLIGRNSGKWGGGNPLLLKGPPFHTLI